MNCTAIKLFFFLLIPHFLLSQSTNLGTPFIKNYIKEDHRAGRQTWDILQTKDGRMLFANNDGLLEFDGNHWRKFPLPKRSILRSIEQAKDGRIYAGGQNEIGYFLADENGLLKFHSLLEKIPEEYQKFGDVWGITIADDVVFFSMGDKIFILQNDKIEVRGFEKGVDFIGKWKNEIWLHSFSDAIYKWENNDFQTFEDNGLFDEKRIRGFLQTGENELLIVTQENGFLKYSGENFTPLLTQFDNYLQNNIITSASLFGNNKIAISTNLGGLVTMDFSGKALRHITKQNGLQSNNVLTIFTDRNQDLWLALDNGIDCIHTSSPYSMIFPDGDSEGAGFTAAAFDNKIYFGTSQGLYFKEWSEYYNPFQQLDFQLVNNTEGQVWGLSNLNNHLFLGHNNGAFEILGNQSKTIFKNPGLGAWTFLSFKDFQDKFLVGTYTGILSVEENNQSWIYEKELPDFFESSRIMVQDEAGNFWMSHPYRGIYQFLLNESKDGIQSVKFYGENEGLPSNFQNHVFKIQKQILIGTENGVFIFDENNGKFQPFEEMNQIFGFEYQVVRLIEDAQENIWFATDKEVGYLKIQDNGLQKSFEKVLLPNLREKIVGGFEFIFPLDESNVFIGAEKGFIHFDKKAGFQIPDSTNFQVNFKSINVTGDFSKLLFGGYILEDEKPDVELSLEENSILFSYSANDFQNSELIEYQYILHGLEDHFSVWSHQIEKEYTNLSWGDYRFEVRSRNANGTISKSANFSFEILPPWYATNLAYGIYSFLILSLLTGLILIPQRQFKKEKAQMESEHQQEVEKSEQTILQLKTEKLESEIAHQNQTLASTTMHLVQKSEMLQKLKSEIAKVAKNSQQVENRKDLNRLVRMIDQDARLDEDWEQFALFFDKVHDNFTQKLREKYPNLTPKDHKLCAYLRMNLNTKEIAPLLNISVRGVEISRYRLRKKLEVPTGENLVDFINSI